MSAYCRLESIREDILLVVKHFLSMYKEKYYELQQRFSDRAMDILMRYDWPGNICELWNVVERRSS